MTQKFYAIVTNLGAAKIANAAALGTKLNITQMAVGDGGGTLPTPNASQTKLVNEVRRAAINTLSIDATNASQVIAEQVIPETEGGFWIREMGLFDAEGTLIAVCNTPETYKPALQEGSGRTQTVRMLIIVNSTDAITLKIDPSVVLATRKYVDDNILTVRQYADQLLADHVAAANPHSQYPLIKNALKEMADAGLLPDVLKNLGLGEGSPVIGSPFPWPHAKMPNELFPSMAGMVFLKSNGATFSSTLYPKLAQVYPGLVLTDLRGEFIRGWDDGRGVDSGRKILSGQGHAFRDHAHNLQIWTGGPTTSSNVSQTGFFAPLATGGDGGIMNTDASPQGLPAGVRAIGTRSVTADNAANISTETRPRNVAFNYIVRAA
ncbi:MAG: phage tail protein [Pantoea sp.]|uniref:phage tail-collar fiber domain-containing protein n=1 Tax=Pantoea sp. TaxID=69393 RepID=UPI0029061EBE|nr:phage tail protein [Pantoea sp.]MDU7838596.1 phage tail protein [Pantoea sp.]